MVAVLEYRRGPVERPTQSVIRTWSLRWYEEAEFEDLATSAGLRVDRVRDHDLFGRSIILQRA